MGNMGLPSQPPLKKKNFFCENNRKSDKIMHCVEIFFFFSGGCEGRPILRAFFGSKLSIYLQNYAKNGLIFKTANQIIFFSTQCIILLLFLWFSQIKMGGHFEPPLIITKVCKPPIITKVNKSV